MPDDRDEVARLRAELARVQALHATSESENARLRGELTESREQQTATAEILEVIASSQAEPMPVFEAVAERAYRLCNASAARIWLVEGELLRLVGTVAESGEILEMTGTSGALGMTQPCTREGTTGRAVVECRVVHIEDTDTDEFRAEYPVAASGGDFARTRLHIPLKCDGVAIGVLAVGRQEVSPFSDGEISLLESFADQAVIAIENARLFEELQESNRQATEALEQQTATSEILRVIASSQAELEPVFEAVAERAYRLCHASSARLYLVDGDVHRIVMSVAESDEAIGPVADLPRRGIGVTGPISRQGMTGRTILDRRVLHLADCASEEVIAEFPIATTGPGYPRSRVHVPLLRDGEAIGVLAVSRMEYAPFSDGEIALLEAFADQAVIAIENARLFQELQESNRQTTEALEQQTASADILRTIASTPTDLQRVLDAVSQTARQLCGAQGAVLHLPEGNVLRPKARGYASDEIFDQSAPPVGPTLDVSGLQAVSGRAFLTGSTVHVPDIEDVAEEFSESAKSGRMRGWRASVAAPLIHGDETLGVLSLYAVEPRSFTDRQIALLESFASQAAIAVANTRLFEELQESNRQATQALEQQTALSEVLRVIASSQAEMQPALDAIATSALLLSHSVGVGISLRLHPDDAWTQVVAQSGGALSNRVGDRTDVTAHLPGNVAMLERRTLHFPDRSSPEFRAQFPNAPSGPVSTLNVPLVSDGVGIGSIQLRRDRPEPYSPREIALLEVFADQAVIAIENARLFQELEQRTSDLTESLEQQTAQAEVLRVIASSPTNPDMVLQSIIDVAARLCEAEGILFQRRERDGMLAVRVGHGRIHAILEALRQSGQDSFDAISGVSISRQSVSGRAFLDGRTVVVDDVADQHEFLEARANFERFSSDPSSGVAHHSQLAVPMLRGGEPIGVLSMSRPERSPFTVRDIALLESFADQAVIAIENARLFQDLQESNRQATEALEQQTVTAEVLRAVASSPTALDHVLDTIVSSAAKLCGASGGGIWIADKHEMTPPARYGTFASPENLIALPRDARVKLTRDSTAGRAILDNRIVHSADIMNDPDFPVGRVLSRAASQRSTLAVPLVSEHGVVGAFSLGRSEVRPFSQREIDLVQTFADQAVIAIENARLFEELQESNRQATQALEQQTALGEVLSIIASSPTDPTRVLDAIASAAGRFTQSDNAMVQQVAGDLLVPVGRYGISAEAVTQGQPRMHDTPISLGTMSGRTLLEGRTIHVPDVAADVEAEFPDSRLPHLRMRQRSQVSTPLVREGRPIGVLVVQRQQQQAFTTREIALLEAFADQAVIAIENARLFQELEQRTSQLTESLEQQTAQAAVLRVIAASPSDLQPVLDAIVEHAVHLCDADDAIIQRLDGDYVLNVAGTGVRYDTALNHTLRVPVITGTISGRAVLDRRTIHVEDVTTVGSEYPDSFLIQRRTLHRTQVSTPLLRDGEPLGILGVYRYDVRPFTDRQITLLETFAAQAVIAIENARLFQELQESNRQAAEALEQQTAQAEVLQVIASSPTDLDIVLETIVKSVARLGRTDAVAFFRVDGDECERMVNSRRDMPGVLRTDIPVGTREPIARDSWVGRAILDRQTLRHDDVEAVIDQEYPQTAASYRRRLERQGDSAYRVRSLLVIPLLSEGIAIGALVVSRGEVRPFTDGEISLLETFADQAAIAIENARLFQELQQRTRELTESLERQTALGEVLHVIASSPTNVQPVLDTVALRAMHLTRSLGVQINLREGGWGRIVADIGMYRGDERPVHPFGARIDLSREMAGNVAIREARTIHTPDRSTAEFRAEFPDSDPKPVAALHVPLLRDGEAIGNITVGRSAPEPYTPGEIALLETFAAQAVIAIENARLFEQLEQRTAQLTRSVDELHVLGEVGQAVSSSLDLQTVLTTIVANATRLAGADGGIVYEYDGDADVFQLRAADQLPDALADALQAARLRLGEGVVGRAALMRGPLQVEDIEQSDLLTPAVFDQLLAAGLRSVLAVPLLREDRVLGGLVLSRRTPGAFPDEVVALLQTLATQSALAIHNARLYQTLEAQGQALSEASQHKSQFLANMSHELRTPLNAVIGYSEMLHEELSDLGQQALVPDVEKITAAGRHLLGLINDILDLSKIEAGKMDLFLESVDVAALLRDVATTVEPLMARNGNQLELHIAPDAGSMYADATKLRQIFFNLLGNAAKFTEHGTIELRVERGEGARDTSPGLLPPPVLGGGGYLTFTVSDNGIGMSDEQLDRLFQAFTQAEASTTRRFGGTGLGLTLVRHFAEMMEGDVQVFSTVGSGSTFVVRLPAAVTSLEQRIRERQVDGAPGGQHPAIFETPLSADSREPFVLIVDDDAASRELLRRYLEADGVRVVEAAGGVEGIRLARQLQPALITLDVLMPGLDGWAVLGMLKDDPATADIPVILLTILDDRDLGYALGAADYLTKPVERDRLLRAVCKHVGRPIQGAARRALVVEDDPATREMLGRLLQREGWSVDEAANGRIGLERVAAGPPDLILLDLMMPELDGFGFVEQLRAEPAWRTIPVLVITAKDLTAQERLRLNGWVEQVLQKGAYTRTELFSEVRALVRASVARAASTASTTAVQRGSDDDGEDPPG